MVNVDLYSALSLSHL